MTGDGCFAEEKHPFIKVTDMKKKAEKMKRTREAFGITVTGKKQNMTVGLPRALLYYRYGTLWKGFFDRLGVKTIVSPPTNKEILEKGTELSIDETCLAAKIFFGHVHMLIGQCDHILVPRICGWGLRREMCTRFASLYDLTCNIFRGSGQSFITYNVDPKVKMDEEEAFLELGIGLGFSRKQVKDAYKDAKKAENEAFKEQLRKQSIRMEKRGMKILLIGHSYVIEDEYIGKHVVDFLKKAGVQVLRADLTDRKDALKKSETLSPTLKWEVNRELIGGFQINREKVKGVILLSVFPCGPDSMANEMIIRKNTDLPLLNLVMDGQEGVAGLETRLESFLDIIRFKEKRE